MPSTVVVTTTLPNGNQELVTRTTYVTASDPVDPPTQAADTGPAPSLQTGNAVTMAKNWALEAGGLAVGVIGVAWAV